MAGTLLAIGAHYDDCVFGVAGTLLQAIRKHYRVVILSIIGDYTNWPPVKGRAQELIDGSTRLAAERGVEARFLSFASHRFDARLENKQVVARAVADIQPDLALFLWGADHHNDHVVASELSRVALRHAGQILEDVNYRPPRRILTYDNGPRHTIGFEPNTFIEITDVWPEAREWLGRLMALVRNGPYRTEYEEPAQRAKETLARYRGFTCGVPWAEALHSALPVPTSILDS